MMWPMSQASSIYDEIKGIEGWLMPAEAEGLYDLAQQHGEVILEVGTFRGRSAVVLVKGALSRPRARPPQFFSLDINPAARITAPELLKGRGIEKPTLFFHGPLSEFRKQFPIAPTMAFIDGDHTYEGVIADLAELSTFLGPRVHVVFHDYLNPDTVGVRKAVDDWCSDGFAEMVRTFDTCGHVYTTAKCTGRGRRLSEAEFNLAKGGTMKRSTRERIATRMPWLVTIVRKLGLSGPLRKIFS